jgi:hypothetical protein
LAPLTARCPGLSRGHNGNLFPSPLLSYAITDNFIAREEYAHTQAKVRFGCSTIPNTTIIEALSADNRHSANYTSGTSGSF